MTTSVETVLVLLILSNLIMSGSSRLAICIRVSALQGIAVGLLPLLLKHEIPHVHLVIFSLVFIALKGAVFPWILFRTLRDIYADREVQPFIGYGISVICGPVALAICFWVASKLPLPVPVASNLVVPAALFTIMSGFFLIISRKKALTQVLGYLVLENGIYTIGIALAQNQPMLVEMGILLDVFAAVFVMGIIIFHINREFDHIDTDQLSTLRT